MGCTTTTAMYLNISTDICASASTSRSGNTVTVSGTFSVNQPGGYNLNAIYAYVDGSTTWQRVKTANSRSGSANFSFSFTDAGAGSRTYTAVFQVWNNAESGPVGNTASTTFSVSWSAGGSAPSNGYINGLTSTYNGTELQFYASSVGVNDGGLALNLNRFQICEVPLTGSGLSTQTVDFTNGQPATLTQSNSTPTHSGVTIVGNHLYYSGLTARNSVGPYYYNGPFIVTPCEPATFSFEPIDSHSISVSYITVADGGYYSKTIEYSLDGENWNIGATVSSSTVSSGTFTISSLDSYKDYTIRFRVRTDAGSTNCNSINFTLLKHKFYGPVFTISAITGTIPANIQVANINWTTFCAALNSLESEYITINNLPTSAILKRYNTGWTMEITLADSTVIYDRAAQFDTGVISPFITKWGVIVDQSHLGTSGDMPLTVTTAGDVTEKINALYGSLNNQTKKIIKYYASENGRAKLIYKENS